MNIHAECFFQVRNNWDVERRVFLYHRRLKETQRWNEKFLEGLVTPLALGPVTEWKFFVPKWQIFGFQSVLWLPALTMRIASHSPGGLLLSYAWEPWLWSEVKGWCARHVGMAWCAWHVSVRWCGMTCWCEMMCIACWCRMMCMACWCGMMWYGMLVWHDVHDMLVWDDVHGMLMWDGVHGMLVWHGMHGMMCMACWRESGPLLPSPPSPPLTCWSPESWMSTLASTPTLGPEMTLCKHRPSLPVDCREGRRSWGWDSRDLGQAVSPPASASCHPVLVWRLGQVLLLQERWGSPRKGPQGSNESWTKASHSSIQSPPARTAFYPVCPRFSLPSNCLPCVALAAIFFPLWCLPCQIFKGSYHVSLAKLHTFKAFSSFLINLGLTALNTYPYMLCAVCFGSGLGSTRIFLFKIIGTSVHSVSLLQTYSQGELGRHDSAHYGFKYSPGPFSPPPPMISL